MGLNKAIPTNADTHGFNFNLEPVDNAFARGAGREYGRWIDSVTAAGGLRDDNNGTANEPLIASARFPSFNTIIFPLTISVATERNGIQRSSKLFLTW